MRELSERRERADDEFQPELINLSWDVREKKGWVDERRVSRVATLSGRQMSTDKDGV